MAFGRWQRACNPVHHGIAHVGPLYERVPPILYGGTERLVYHLVEEQVRRGHEVTLFASGDSMTSAEVVAPVDHALRLDPPPDQLAPHVLELAPVFERADEFDRLRLGASRIDVMVRRSHDGAGVEVLDRDGDAEVVVRR